MHWELSRFEHWPEWDELLELAEYEDSAESLAGDGFTVRKANV